jgi:hypothetical protein
MEANHSYDRRGFLGKTLLATGAGALAGLSLEERALLSWAGETPSPTAALPDKPLPQGRLGKLKVSRLICGGNLFSGFAHSRDLIYVSRLLREYFTPEKIMDTLRLCEENGINTALLRCDKHVVEVLGRYRRQRGGKIQWIAQVYPGKDNMDNVKLAIDNGAVAAVMQGEMCDRWVAEGLLDRLGKVLALIRENGLVAGLSGHKIETIQAIENARLEPDFYFKTFNSARYQSEAPEEIAVAMKSVKQPWIAFKVLGAGVVEPREGFAAAFTAGADFLNVGMFDFQVSEDVKIVSELLAGDCKRERPWRS